MTPSQVAMVMCGGRECCCGAGCESAAVQSNVMGYGLERCLGRQSPRASQCKSQPGG